MADNTIARALTDLLNINRTSVKGYQEAAESVQSPELKAQLSQFSQQRAGFVSVLEQHAQQFGLNASDTTTVESLATDAAAALHRGWIDVKSALTGKDDSSVLEAAKTGEAAALKAYETALGTSGLPADAQGVLQQQHAQILEAKNWLEMHKTN